MQCRLGALQRPQIMQKMRSRYGRLHQSTGPVEPGFRRGTDLLDFGSTAKPRVVRFLKKKLVLWNSTALHPPEKSGTNLRNLKSSVKSVKSLVDSEYMEIFWNQTIKPRIRRYSKGHQSPGLAGGTGLPAGQAFPWFWKLSFQDTGPLGAQTLQIHDFELGSKISWHKFTLNLRRFYADFKGIFTDFTKFFEIRWFLADFMWILHNYLGGFFQPHAVQLSQYTFF